MLILTLFLVPPLYAGTATITGLPQQPYLIGPGDVLMVSIWKEEALTQDVVVQPDGKIVFPLIGNVVVAGKSPEGVRKEISAKIKPFVPDPILTVSVRQINSLMIYVVGKVNQPGRFVLNANVNVLQALAIAGGLNSFANGSKIKVFRETSKGTKIYNFDFDDVSKGKRLEQNIGLKRGDVIVVP
jgi:polysaccharide export outer membrane protein